MAHFPLENSERLTEKSMRLEDLLNNELRIRPPLYRFSCPLFCRAKLGWGGVHPPCYFWKVCNNKLPLGSPVKVQKGSVSEPKL